jgi:hypothetical protein
MLLEILSLPPTDTALAMWWNLKIVSPEPQPNKNTKVEVNKQKPKRITSAETAADIDNDKANNVKPPYCQTVLYVRPSPRSSTMWVCPTAECCLWVGTRQALLQGWLLCVGFVCLANVPDLVRWLLESSPIVLKS